MSQGVEKLDYVIGTHPDADHIGGLDVVIYKFDCDTIIMPDVANDTRTYDDVVQAMKSKGYQTTYPVVGETYTLGGATFTIVAPNADYGNDMNDWSGGCAGAERQQPFPLYRRCRRKSGRGHFK